MPTNIPTVIPFKSRIDCIFIELCKYIELYVYIVFFSVHDATKVGDMRGFHHLRRTTSRSAITLIELIVVMAIMSMIAVMAVPSLYSLLTSHGLSTGVRNVSNHLVLARSEAIARHTLTRFLIATTWTEEGGALRKFSTWCWNADTTKFDRISEWYSLPKGIIFEPQFPDYILKSDYALNDATSVVGEYLLSKEDAAMEVEAFDGKPIKVQFVEFLPTGAARIPGGTLNTVIFVLVEGEIEQGIVGSTAHGAEPASFSPAKSIVRGNHNWAQVNLGTLTGRVRIYRP